MWVYLTEGWIKFRQVHNSDNGATFVMRHLLNKTLFDFMRSYPLRLRDYILRY